MIDDIKKAIEYTERKITKICESTVYYQGDTVKRMYKICNLLSKKSEMLIYGLHLDMLIAQEKPRNQAIIRDVLNHKGWRFAGKEYGVSQRTVARVMENFNGKNEEIIKKIKKLCENSCVFKNYRV